MYPCIGYGQCPYCKKKTLMISKNGRPFIPYICRDKRGCGMSVSLFEYDELMRYNWKRIIGGWEKIS